MVTSQELTRELVESLVDWAHPNGEGLDPNYAPDRYLAADIRTWLRWDSSGRRTCSPYLASKKIASAINFRAKEQP